MTPQAALVADPFTHTAGFGGLCAVIAAVITAAGVAVTLLVRSRVARRDAWWARSVSMLDQLTTTARQLRDPDLIAFAERYTRHVYAELPSPSPQPRHQAHTRAEQPEGDQR